jgi:GlpG protein
MVISFWLDQFRHGEFWRLFTPMFLHWDPLHLIFNLFWLRDLGGMIETRRGSWRMLGLVLAAALISNFAQFAWTLPGVDNFGGMSGVVYALFGYVWIKNRYQPSMGLNISKETSLIMIAWLFLCMTGLVGPIANTAHVAGLIVGAATAWAPYAYKRVR